MDTDMEDVSYDIDVDVGTGQDASTQQAVQPAAAQPAPRDNDTQMPAAYFESLDHHPKSFDPWPETLNLQGVASFDPNDPLYYAMEYCPPQLRVKQTRWVNDNSVNLEYYSVEDAAAALVALTHPDAGDATSLSPETPRRARVFSKNPDSILTIRLSNSGDQKQRGAANRSGYYRQNPNVRERGRDREPRRRPPRSPPRPAFLDYDGVESSEPRRRSTDDRMRYDSDMDARRNRRNGDRDRGGRRSDVVDRYRPGSRSPESRYGRLRGRSASPISDGEGDGRLGFAEDGTSMRRSYRSGSRGRSDRRRPEPSGERWTHDRASFFERGYGTSGGASIVKAGNAPPAKPYKTEMMTVHRRSDATDETANARKGSLLSRMTKDGQPLAGKPSLASRITRGHDDEPTFGRLKDDYSIPRDDYHHHEPTRKRDLASRITRDDEDDDGISIRGRSGQSPGLNIRGSASKNGSISVRGVAANRV